MILTAAQAASPAPPKPDRTLVRALVLTNAWARDLESDRVASIKALADKNGLCNHYTARMMPLAYLAPDL